MTLACLLAVAFAPALAHADHGDCGQPSSHGPNPGAGDALMVLRSSIGDGECGDDQDECECDVDDSGVVTPTDSLVILRSAVGFAVALNCGCDDEDETTTTLQGSSDSTTTTLSDDDQGDDDGGDIDDDGPGDDDPGDDID
jgi:hypothetical protein